MENKSHFHLKSGKQQYHFGEEKKKQKNRKIEKNLYESDTEK